MQNPTPKESKRMIRSNLGYAGTDTLVQQPHSGWLELCSRKLLHNKMNVLENCYTCTNVVQSLLQSATQLQQHVWSTVQFCSHEKAEWQQWIFADWKEWFFCPWHTSPGIRLTHCHIRKRLCSINLFHIISHVVIFAWGQTSASFKQ